jgi:adenylate cyclase
MKRIRRWAQKFGAGRSICILLLFALIGVRVWDPPPLQELRLRTFDIYQKLVPRPLMESSPAIILDIDEPSLSAFGQWPWPRTLIADIVTRLSKLGAAAVAFDIIFAEPDRVSPNLVAGSLAGLDDETREKLLRLPSNDQVLAAAMRETRVILGQSVVHVPDPQTQTRPPTSRLGMLGPDPSPFLWTGPGLVQNVPELEQAAAGRGVLTIIPEPDGIVRRVPLILKAQGAIVPALTMDLLRVVGQQGAILVKTEITGVQSVGFRGLVLPTDRHAQVWVHFRRHDPQQFISVKDLMENRVDPARIAGKLVFIGTSAVGFNDLKATPVHGAMPGVEIHTQILESALTGSVLERPGYATLWEMIVAVVISAAIIAFAPIVSAAIVLVMGGAVALALVGISAYYYLSLHTLLDFTFPWLCTFSVYMALIFINYFREQNQRRQIRSAFGQYLAPALVEQLANSPEKLVLGGEDRDMTILFSDVRGFTSISELYKADPQGLTTLMNRLLTPLTNVIIEHQGTIDKYMGDAVMAFWNAPLDDPDHEINACASALEMIDRLDQLNRERQQEAHDAGQRFIPFRIGIGINTGRCVVGNLGSDLRFNYSVLGDPVNVASRLEGQTKYYGVPVIIGSRTAEKAKDKFAILEVDLITVKGKTEPEAIYTVIGREQVAADIRFQELRKVYSAMLYCYRSRDWEGALEALQASRARDEDFGLEALFDMYRARIQAFSEVAPPSDWNGVFVAETK